MDVDKAISFVDKSIGINKNGTNSFTKSVLLDKKGNTEESKKLREEAFVTATEAEINALGYQFLFGGKLDLAMEVFKKNVENFPDSWNVYDSLGECYAAAKDNNNAKKYYSIALEKAPDAQKDRIKGIIVNLN
jgi:tetratricopeptide (TPR) repeat protein